MLFNVHFSMKLSPSSLGSIAKCRSLQNLKLSQLPMTDKALGRVSVDNFPYLTRFVMVLH